MEIRHQKKLITSYKYLASIIFNPLRRVNHNPNLRSPSEKKINRAIGPSKPTKTDWEKIKAYNRHLGQSINHVALSTLNRVCHVIVMKNQNITTLVHLIPIILHLVERVPHVNIGTYDLPQTVRYRSKEDKYRPQNRISQWAVFSLPMANETAMTSSIRLVDRQTYTFSKFQRKLDNSPHLMRGMINASHDLTIHDVIQNVVAAPAMTTVSRIIELDRDLALQHEEGNMYKKCNKQEMNPEIFEENTRHQPRRVVKLKLRQQPQCLTLMSGEKRQLTRPQFV
jgi:hypothetical protein